MTSDNLINSAFTLYASFFSVFLTVCILLAGLGYLSSTHTHTHTPMLLSFAREEALPCKHIASSKSSSDGVKGNCWHTRLLCCTTGGHTAIGYFFVSFFYFSVIFFSRVSCWRRKWQPTPVFLPGESQGRGSLVGCHLWGRTESDTTEAT